jgi:hypothetical protein
MASAAETLIGTLIKMLGIPPEMVQDQLKKVDEIRQIIAAFKAQQDEIHIRLIRIENLLAVAIQKPGELTHDDPGTVNGRGGDTRQPAAGD